MARRALPENGGAHALQDGSGMMAGMRVHWIVPWLLRFAAVAIFVGEAITIYRRGAVPLPWLLFAVALPLLLLVAVRFALRAFGRA
jgi:hypothetical protein